MITLTKVKGFVKKYFWLLAACVLIILILNLVFLRFYFIQKTKTPQVESPTFEKKIITTSKFNTDNLVIPRGSPDKLPLYAITRENLLNSASTIAQRLDFSGSATLLQDINLGQGFAYSNETSSLVIYKNSLNYVKDALKEVNGNFESIDKLKKTADDFFTNVNLPIPISHISDIAYFKVNDEFLTKTKNPTEAAILTLTLQPTIAEYELLFAESGITASFNKQNELFNLVYESAKLERSTEGYPVMSGQKAKEELLNNHGTLLKIRTVNDYTPPPRNLDTVKIEKMYLAYYLPINSNLAQPVWIFEGEAESPGGLIGAIYAVPAVEKTYLLTTPSPKP